MFSKLFLIAVFSLFELVVSESACIPVSNLTFCSDISYTSYIDTNSNITQLDQDANSYFTAFNNSLYQYRCQDEESVYFYSPVRTCADCTLAYKTWLCTITFPKCDQSNADILKPCESVCYNVIQSCPQFLGFDCPKPQFYTPDYAAKPNCNTAGLNIR